jgi:small subunit ribosomal protein S4
MARHSGPKNKLARRIGEDLGLKTNALKVARRIAILPGQHGARGRRKISNYGVQLREKQKVKYIYGIMEKQLRKLYSMASKNPTATGAALLSLLERRLDNVVFRMGWAPTRASARQFVSHNHIQVNGKKMDVPSYQVKVGDVITMKSKTAKVPVVSEMLKQEVNPPEWLKVKGGAGSVAALPKRSDIQESIDEQMIVEYYSR